jgi:hypothetical protein
MSSVLPASVPLSLWEEFRKMRKKKRAPLTEYAETLILCKLEKWRVEVGANPIDVLKESIEKGWTTVYLNGHAQRGGTSRLPSEGSGVASAPIPAPICASCGRSLEAGFIHSRKGRVCGNC